MNVASKSNGEVMNLKRLLRSRNITIIQAAKMLEIERETLHRKIAGKQPFYLAEAVKLYEMYFPDLDFFEIFSVYIKKTIKDLLTLQG